MKKLFLIYIILFLFYSAISQQLPQLSQYQLDDIIFNPAALGTKTSDRIVLHHRSQWLGFEGSPITQFISYNGSFNGDMGLGGYIMNDITGPTRRLSFNAGYAYNFGITRKMRLSLGLMATIMQYGIDGNKVTIHEADDPSIYQGYSDRSWKPDVSIGSYVYTQDFYAGLSVMQLFVSRVKLFKNEPFTAVVPLVPHFYMTSGYAIHLNDETSVTPSIAMHGTMSSPLQFDVNVKGSYKDMVYGGLTYRYKDAIILMLGTVINEKFAISYSFDIVVSQLRKANSGSHEIVLGVYLKKKDERGRSLI